MTIPPDPQLALIRWPEVSRITGFKSKSHVKNLEKSGFFPRAVRIGERAQAWVQIEVNDWIAARIAARDCKVSEEVAL